MFEYSSIPFSDIANTHIGFILMCVFALIYFLISVDSFEEGSFIEIALGLIVSGMLILTGYNSFSIDNSAQCSKYQETIVAEFVGFSPEVYKQRSGKSDVTHHKIYLHYRYGNDNILTETSSTAAPKYATFYRINVREHPSCIGGHNGK